MSKRTELAFFFKESGQLILNAFPNFRIVDRVPNNILLGFVGIRFDGCRGLVDKVHGFEALFGRNPL